MKEVGVIFSLYIRKEARSAYFIKKCRGLESLVEGCLGLLSFFFVFRAATVF
jgi:hypothetical protein